MDALRREFSFIKGNYAVLVVSWILIDFAMEIPTAYYALYVLGLGATETIVGTIGLFQFLALASMQFPGGYLADKFGRRWIVCLMTFGVALSFIFMAVWSLAGGILYEHFAPQLPFFIAAASVLPAFVLTFALVHGPEQREE
jgi:MFS family permease